MKLFIVVAADDRMTLGAQGFTPAKGGSPWVTVEYLDVRASGADLVEARDRCIVELRRTLQPRFEDQHDF